MKRALYYRHPKNWDTNINSSEIDVVIIGDVGCYRVTPTVKEILNYKRK